MENENLKIRLKSFAGEDSLPMWYHENLSRKDCERLLRRVFRMPHPDQPERKGVFLVRDCSKVNHRFVLSKYTENDLRHVLIYQHGNDAFFSLDCQRIFHGLDELVKFYQENDDESQEISLTSFSFVKGQHPPMDFCKLGQQRLLHRAVIMNHLRIVKEAVTSQTLSLDAKDKEGKTALHYTCFIDYIDLNIPKLLIENGASLMIRDSSGKIPFVYACENGRKEIVEMMIKKNKEVIQIRNSTTHDVPLHVVARSGKTEIVKLLLANDAALNPINKEGKRPIDLAADERHEEVVIILSRHRSSVKTSASNWMHGCLTRKQARFLLMQKREELSKSIFDCKNLLQGLFLVRLSETRGHVISILENDDMKNHEIKQNDGHFCLDQGPLMWSIEHLITHYMTFNDGLTSKLTIPLKPLQPCTNLDAVKPLPLDASNWQSNNNFTKSDSTFEESLYDEIVGGNEDTYIWLKKSTPVPTNDYFDGLFIDEANLEISSEQLGEGQFGTVCRGILVLPGKSYRVAIKMLRDDDININHDPESFCSFLREAGTMMVFDHPNIVKMLGIVKNPPMRIVQELQALGSLLNYLVDHGDDITSNDINIWATQIAEGMEYLEIKRFVHRDLAARNILLASKTHARISDFGLTRTISVENKTFNQLRSEKLPIKWYAPECYYGKFSHASDVWSFAVTLWEAYTKGEEPYQDMNAFEVMSYVMRGGRLNKPSSCPDDIFHTMLDCWQNSGTARPSFLNLVKYFKRYAPIYENKNLLVPSK